MITEICTSTAAQNFSSRMENEINQKYLYETEEVKRQLYLAAISTEIFVALGQILNKLEDMEVILVGKGNTQPEAVER